IMFLHCIVVSEHTIEKVNLLKWNVVQDSTMPMFILDAIKILLEWTRPDLDPRFVHVRRDGDDRLFDQHSSYKGRTSVSINGLRRGDMSLKLSKVTFSDQGTYRCFVPGFEIDTSVKLVVGKPANMLTNVFIEITNVSRGVLQCESTGWGPEPEVFWLDGEGNLLSAGPTETVRGPDDLYTVSSRVTVEKRHSNSFASPSALKASVRKHFGLYDVEGKTDLD
uniref:Ig-like domain-containing protein n=1 Tax=Sparus aurata TaxID=8175 RepID=A0A671TNL7_SPAAU